MTARRSGGRSSRNAVDCDLELRPLMNVFIVLIPMLLMSAVFMEIRVIETSSSHASAASAAQPASPELHLSLIVRGNEYVLTGTGFAPITVIRNDAARAGAFDEPTATRLASVLEQVVSTHPDNHEIRIVAESKTRYQEIVSLMDLARAAGLPDSALEGTMEGA